MNYLVRRRLFGTRKYLYVQWGGDWGRRATAFRYPRRFAFEEMRGLELDGVPFLSVVLA